MTAHAREDAPVEPQTPYWMGILVGVLAAACIATGGYAIWRPKAHARRIAVVPAATSVPVASAPAPPVSVAAAVVVYPAVHPASAASAKKTPERLAADALHAGDFHRAAVMYRDLAVAHPENPAFSDAARMLAER
jgi:hypothetical protein